MNLKRSHIASYGINWNEKAENLKEISDELGVSTDSFVFWDDNPLERERMKILLPEVLTIDAPKNVTEWPKLLRSLDAFSKFTLTEEDKNKANQYKIRAKFKKNLKNSGDLSSYLKSIDLRPSISPVNETNIARAVQMCQKTNQFNLSLRRHNLGDLRKRSTDRSFELALISLKDTYGDHGFIALFSMRCLDKKYAFLETFLMSCRILDVT